MKKNIKKLGMLIVIFFAFGINPFCAWSASYVVGISPHYDGAHRTKVFEGLLTFTLETAAPGDEITVVDALNQKLVARFTIPQGTLFQSNAQARARRLGPPILALKQFLMTERSHPRELNNAIALPQFLDFAATQLRRPGEPMRVIVLGSPFYVDVAGEGAFSMATAYPADGNLLVDQQLSLFGCAQRKQALSGVAVHFAYLDARFVNDYHQERICRFYSLYCQQTGGVLGTFCADGAIAFQRAKENSGQPCVPVQLDASDTKIEMRQVVHRGIASTIRITNDIQQVVATNLVPSVAVTVAEPPPRPVETTAPVAIPVVTNSPETIVEMPAPISNPPPAIVKLAEAFPVKPTANKVGVGIAWSAPVDLDLWVRAHPDARDLYFRNTVTPEGRYFRDWRSGNLGLDYEYIELDPEPDVDLSKVGCWINYFEGKTTPVRGVALVFYEGKSYFGEFTLNAPGGNKANDKDKRDQSRYWIRLNLEQIVKSGNQIRPATTPRS